MYRYSAQRISHGCSSSECAIYKAQNFELKQTFTRYSAPIWNSTQWGNHPVNCRCTQLLITFTVNVLHLTSSVISFPRDDGPLSSLRLPSKARFISKSVTMWMFISWINYRLTFPLRWPYFHHSRIPIFQLIKRKKGIWLKSKGGNSRAKHALQDLDTQTSVPDTTFFQEQTDISASLPILFNSNATSWCALEIPSIWCTCR